MGGEPDIKALEAQVTLKNDEIRDLTKKIETLELESQSYRTTLEHVEAENIKLRRELDIEKRVHEGILENILPRIPSRPITLGGCRSNPQSVPNNV